MDSLNIGLFTAGVCCILKTGMCDLAVLNACAVAGVCAVAGMCVVVWLVSVL